MQKAPQEEQKKRPGSLQESFLLAPGQPLVALPGRGRTAVFFTTGAALNIYLHEDIVLGGRLENLSIGTRRHIHDTSRDNADLEKRFLAFYGVGLMDVDHHGRDIPIMLGLWGEG